MEWILKSGLFQDVITKTEPSQYIKTYTNAIMLGGLVPKFINRDKGEYSKFKTFRLRTKYAQAGDTEEDIQRKIEIHRFNEMAKKNDKFSRRTKRAIQSGLAKVIKIGYLPQYVESQKEVQRQYRELMATDSYETKKQIYNNIKSGEAMRKKRYSRHLTAAKNIATGTYGILSGIPLILEQGGASVALHKINKGVKTLQSEFSSNESKIRKRLQIDGAEAGGIIERDIEKLDKDIKKNDATGAALHIIARQEADIQQAIARIKARAKELAKERGISESEINELIQNELKSKISCVNRTNISSTEMKKAIVNYTYSEGKTTVSEKDIAGIMMSLQNVLKENDEKNNNDNKKRLTRDVLTGGIDYTKLSTSDGSGVSIKDATAILVEEVNKMGLVKNSKNNNVPTLESDAQIQQQISFIQTTLKGMYGTNQKNVAKNKKNAVNYNSIIREIIDKFGEAKQ